LLNVETILNAERVYTNMTLAFNSGPQQTYDDLSATYDGYTSTHRHEQWLSTIEQVAQAHGVGGRRLLDVACGTGNSFLPLLERGYEVSGCDLSPKMAARARSKSRGKANVFVADMRALGEIGEFDLVTCLDDSLNYLSDRSDLVATFEGVAQNLAPAGLLVFDVNTLRAYRTTFSADACWESDGCFFAWRGETSPDFRAGGIAVASTEGFVPDAGLWRRTTTRHEQRHFPDQMVRDALEAAGLHCLAAYGHRPDGTLAATFQELRDHKRIYVAALPT
jgi:SAM-dependent methyltransferase